MPVKVVHLPDIGNVTFSQNLRIKNIKISVRASREVRISFPMQVSFHEVMNFIDRHKSWISEQKQKYQQNLPKFDFPIKTRYHTIRIQPEGEKFRLVQKDWYITIFYPPGTAPDNPLFTEYTKKLLDETLHREAKQYLPMRISELAQRHGFAYGKVTIRNNRSNWGSCSGRNNINLNYKLMKLPDHLIDFILLHELAHTQVKNHGPKFWALLDALSGGNSKAYTREVKKLNTLAF